MNYICRCGHDASRTREELNKHLKNECGMNYVYKSNNFRTREKLKKHPKSYYKMNKNKYSKRIIENIDKYINNTHKKNKYIKYI